MISESEFSKKNEKMLEKSEVFDLDDFVEKYYMKIKSCEYINKYVDRVVNEKYNHS